MNTKDNAINQGSHTRHQSFVEPVCIGSSSSGFSLSCSEKWHFYRPLDRRQSCGGGVCFHFLFCFVFTSQYQDWNQAHTHANVKGNVKALFCTKKPCETREGFAEADLTELKIMIPSRRKHNTLQTDAALLLLSMAPWTAFLHGFPQKSSQMSFTLVNPSIQKQVRREDGTHRIGRDWKSSWFILSDWRIFSISV